MNVDYSNVGVYRVFSKCLRNLIWCSCCRILVAEKLVIRLGNGDY